MTKFRGELTPEQIERLDEVLVHHGFPKSSPHVARPVSGLAAACLGCGSVSRVEAEDGTPTGHMDPDDSADFYVDNYDFDHPECDGDTVVFHSTAAVLVDPSKLTIITRVDDGNKS